MLEQITWLLVSTPLKNISQLGWLSRIIPNRWKNKSHVPNHQPATLGHCWSRPSYLLQPPTWLHVLTSRSFFWRCCGSFDLRPGRDPETCRLTPLSNIKNSQRHSIILVEERDCMDSDKCDNDNQHLHRANGYGNCLWNMGVVSVVGLWTWAATAWGQGSHIGF